MNSPDYVRLCERLRAVAWFAALGRPISEPLPFEVRQLETVAEALVSIQQPAWEDWTQERANDLTAWLAKRAPRRDASWNQLVKEAKRFVEGELEPIYLPPLSAVFPHAVVVDCVRWDLVSALMEAAHADLKPPAFFTRIVPVYESGHLPVGWDEAEGGRLLIY